MIIFDKVDKHYDHDHKALSDVSLIVKDKEFAFLTGHSGAGKSTFLKLIMGIERPTSGKVLVDDVNITKASRKKIALLRRRIGVVYQSHKLLFDRNVYENIALPLHISGFHPREISRRVLAALDKVGLKDKVNVNPRMLSGGEQQRVGIARAVVNKPSILLADEPTGNLDPELSAEIMKLFLDFNQVGVTVLVATHDIALIAKMPHRSITLRKGQFISVARTPTAPGTIESTSAEQQVVSDEHLQSDQVDLDKKAPASSTSLASMTSGDGGADGEES